MAVSYIKNEYNFYLPEWVKIRDFAEGSRKVKAKGETYLKRLNGPKSCIINDTEVKTTFYYQFFIRFIN